MLEWTGSWSLGRRLSMRLTFTSGAGPGPDNLSHQLQICHWRGRGSRDSSGGTAGTSSSRGSGLSALTSKAPSAPPLSSPKRELPAAPSAAPPASAGIEGDRTAQKSRLLQIKKKKSSKPLSSGKHSGDRGLRRGAALHPRSPFHSAPLLTQRPEKVSTGQWWRAQPAPLEGDHLPALSLGVLRTQGRRNLASARPSAIAGERPDQQSTLPYTLPFKHDSNTAPPPSARWLVLAAPTGCGLLGVEEGVL